MTEPSGLTITRIYTIQWKKQALDTAELARLRYQEGLTWSQVAAKMGIPITTAATAHYRLEKRRKKERQAKGGAT